MAKKVKITPKFDRQDIPKVVGVTDKDASKEEAILVDQPENSPLAAVAKFEPVCGPREHTFVEEGDVYRFELVRRTHCAAEGWTRKIEVMQVYRDCVLKTSTLYFDHETKRILSCSEALVLIPNCSVDQIKRGKI